MRRIAAVLGAAAVLAAAVAAPAAQGHAGLIRSDPAAGATLGASPAAVKLNFSERPEASLSRVTVRDRRGTPRQAGSSTASGSALVARVTKLPRGVYTVSWRVVSAVDGHASTGALAFGVGESPKGVALPSAGAAKAVTSKLELLARWILLGGLAILLGAAVAGVAGFGERGTAIVLAAAGAALAALGLLLLAEAQRRAADSSLTDLLKTPVGEALIWRALALAAAVVALFVAHRSKRAIALAAAAVAAVAAIVVHVASGHAAAGSWASGLTVTAQSVHFAAAGVWFGGLAALLAGLRGAAPAARTKAVRRFSAVALGAVLAVAATGLLRAVDELSDFGQLGSTGYGRAVVAKVLLLALIVALASRNRRRNVAEAGRDPGPLRRTSRAELGLAVGALATAAILGTLAPPVATPASASPAGLSAKSMGGRLSTASPEPGPNTFTLRPEKPQAATTASLRFTPLDDPGVGSTTLALRRTPSGQYEGAGDNLRFAGRWQVVARVGSAAIPFELDVPGPEQFVSVARVPGQPAAYTMEVGNDGYVRLTLDPERPGASSITVTAFDEFENFVRIRRVVLTAAAGGAPLRPVPLNRLGADSYGSILNLSEGTNRIGVTIRTRFGTRLHGVFELKIPPG